MRKDLLKIVRIIILENIWMEWAVRIFLNRWGFVL